MEIKITSIASDADGVIFNLANYQYKKGIPYFKKRGVELHDGYAYNIEDMFNCSYKERTEFWAKNIWEYSLFEEANPGVIENQTKWKSEGRKIPIITSRVYVTENTIKGAVFRGMLKFNLNIVNRVPHDEIHLCGEENSAQDKVNVMKKIGASALIDDKVNNCIAVSKSGRIAFNIDNPWNLNLNYPNVIKVNDYYDVNQAIEMIEGGDLIKNFDPTVLHKSLYKKGR